MVVRGPGRLSVEEVGVAAPRGREVLIRSRAAGLCHSDGAFIDGSRSHDLPFIPGHEGAGVVEAVGVDVRGLATGDHVVVCAVPACGACRACARRLPWLCQRRQDLARPFGDVPRLRLGDRPVHQFRGLSTFSELMLVDERSAVRVAPQLDLDLAAVLGCAVATGAGSVLNEGVGPEDTVAVIGCGGVGLNVVRAAALVGAERVVAVDVNPMKLELAQSFGATDTVDATAGDVVRRVREVCTGGVDRAYEVVGRAETLRQAFDLLAPGGTAYVVGVAADEVEVSLPMSELLLGRSVKGLYLGSTRPQHDIPVYVEWSLSGRLDLGALVTHRVPLTDVGRAYAELEAGGVARAVVVFDA